MPQTMHSFFETPKRVFNSLRHTYMLSFDVICCIFLYFKEVHKIGTMLQDIVVGGLKDLQTELRTEGVRERLFY